MKIPKKIPVRKNETTYLWTAAGTCIFLLSLLLFGLNHFHATDRLPPIPFTSELSFDEKIQLFRQRASLRSGVVVMGSSMAFNNVAMSVLNDSKLGSEGVINFGSWSSKIRHSHFTFEAVKPLILPKIVLLPTSVMDFTDEARPSDWFNAWDVRTALKTKALDPYFFLKYASIPYFFSLYTVWREWRTNEGNYISLKIDEFGGVPLHMTQMQIDPARWNTRVAAADFDDPRNYAALEAWVKEANVEGYCLIVAQTPLRAASLEPGVRGILEHHWSRLAKTLATRQSAFLNLHSKLLFSDEMFADYSHLNTDGAKAFTRAWIHEMRGTCADRVGSHE